MFCNASARSRHFVNVDVIFLPSVCDSFCVSTFSLGYWRLLASRSPEWRLRVFRQVCDTLDKPNQLTGGRDAGSWQGKLLPPSHRLTTSRQSPLVGGFFLKSSAPTPSSRISLTPAGRLAQFSKLEGHLDIMLVGPRDHLEKSPKPAWPV